MRALTSQVNRHDKTFQERLEKNLADLEKLHAAFAKLHSEGNFAPEQKETRAQQLSPRERVARLLDPGSAFLEIAALAGANVANHSYGAGLIAGIGKVSGVDCVITANNYLQKGGAMTELGVQKTNRVSAIALENRLPSVSLIESAGADLPNQAKIFLPGGQGFRDLAIRSKERLTTVCLVFGSSTAGGAYIPGMSDYTVMVKKRAQVYLAGPPLVKMATGEESTHEQLGGAEMHAKVSGVADYLAESELDAIRIGREIIGNVCAPQDRDASARCDEPLFDASDLLGIVPPDPRAPYEVREVIARLVDGSRFSEFKPEYGPTLVTGFAELGARRVGVLGNNGALFTDSANKGAQFIELCNQRSIPLIFLQNIVGFMVGREYEEEGIIKAGAKMIQAVSNSNVPAITVMIGASFGAGNYAMNGRAYAPRFLFSWPTHRIAVMGGKQLAGVLEIIKRDSAQKKGLPVDEEQLRVAKMMIEGQIETESDPYFATARLFDDGVIDPRDTRTVLGLCLDLVHQDKSWQFGFADKTRSNAQEWGVRRH